MTHPWPRRRTVSVRISGPSTSANYASDTEKNFQMSEIRRFQYLVLILTAAVCNLTVNPTFAQSLAGGPNSFHTLAIRPDGTVAAWGFNDWGQVSGAASVTGATAVSAGNTHSLALRSDGTVAAWGFDISGQVSGGASVTSATAVSAGYRHSLALRSNGTVAAWGSNSHGQVSGAASVTGATSVSAGLLYSLALRSNGTVAAWGFNGDGQISGTASVTGATAISAGRNHALALRSNGTVAAWGANGVGEVSGAASVTGATAVSAGAHHSLALRSNGTVAAWGFNSEGQVSGAAFLNNVVYAVAGNSHNYAVLRDGTITSWGRGFEGQRNPPGPIALPTTVRWTTATNGDYLNSHLWDGRIPSTALSTAVFGQSGSYAINFGNTASAAGLDVQAGNVTFNLNGNQYLVGGNVAVSAGASLTADGNISSGSLSGSGTVNLTSGTLTTGSSNSSTTFSGAITGTGGLTKTGTGTMTLSGTNTYSGATNVNQGTLALGANNVLSDSTTVNLSGGTTLSMNNFSDTVGGLGGAGNVSLGNGGSGHLTVGANNGSTTFGGKISGLGQVTKVGTGTMTLVGSNQFNSTTVLTVQAGTVDVGSATAFSTSFAPPISVQSAGTLNLNGFNVRTAELTNAGEINLGSGGALFGDTATNSGTINASGGILSFETLVNDGTIIGSYSVFGSEGNTQTISGTGSMDALTVGSGGIVAPGNSIGSMSIDELLFEDAGTYQWELLETTGTPGTEWDLLTVDELTITAGLADPFVIEILSGPIASFNQNQDYTWTILSATGFISGFQPGIFSVDASGFQNSFTGSFSVLQNGNNLDLSYSASAVPEPTSFGLILVFTTIGLSRRRRRRKPAFETSKLTV